MKRHIIFFFFLLSFNSNLFSQTICDTIKKYETWYWRVCCCFAPDSLSLIGKFEASIQHIKSDTIQPCYYKYYQLSVNYALINEIDSAFHYLNRFVETSPDDRMLYVDKRWDVLRKDTAQWKSLIDKIEDGYLSCLDNATNKELALRLFRLGVLDQKYRVYWNTLRQLPTDSAGLVLADAEQNYLFEQTLAIYNTYGFPGVSMVGKTASTAAFLLLQHSPYIDQYYYTIEKAFSNSDIEPEQYAMCIDRHLVQNGKKQIYGTQFYSTDKTQKKYGRRFLIRPIKDYKHLNERRKSIGLAPIEKSILYKNAIIPQKYIKHWNKQRKHLEL